MVDSAALGNHAKGMVAEIVGRILKDAVPDDELPVRNEGRRSYAHRHVSWRFHCGGGLEGDLERLRLAKTVGPHEARRTERDRLTARPTVAAQVHSEHCWLTAAAQAGWIRRQRLNRFDDQRIGDGARYRRLDLAVGQWLWITSPG